MNIRLVTVEEANQLLPQITPQVQKLANMKREFDRLETRLDVLGIATSGAAADNPDTLELRSLSERRRRLGETIGREIEALQDHGCLLKDIDAGLVDFYTLVGDRLVFLCWKLGEPEISHWHSLQDGYSGRQPLKNIELE